MPDPVVDTKADAILESIRRLTTDVSPAGPLILTPEQRIWPEVHDRLAPIDDEVLHDLVRDLLTEELQGPLGEKITRSIRKMVRAEIGRALAERDLK